MATKELVTKVWIEEGCIVCDACETAAPEVFEVLEETCIIRPEAMNADFNKPRSEGIVDAAEECPVDVIKFDTVTEEVSDEAAAPAESPAVAEPTEAAAVKSPEAPAPPPAPSPSAAPKAAPSQQVAASATTSMAGEPDPAIAALLRAATSRGGNVGILRKQESIPETLQAWQRKDPRELPPDARQARR